MKAKSRIDSILKAKSLDSSITGVRTFNLSDLILESEPDFQLPTNLRLGHLAEKVVAGLIRLSTNYDVLYENIQLVEDKKTIGEIDFIIADKNTKQLYHMEMAYKFYLYDSETSSKSINNWIGPNRNDSLKEKLEKVKNNQFSLLNHGSAKSKFDKLELSEVSQVLCLLVSLFIPYEGKSSFSPTYEEAIKGYYINFEKFISIDQSEKSYYLPLKIEWGMDPSENNTWSGISDIEKRLRHSIEEEQAQLVWQKFKGSYLSFFIVWW